MKDNSEHVGDNTRLDNDSGISDGDTVDCPVTARSKEVLECAAQGMSAKETAIYLELSHRTVEAHLLAARLALFARNTTNAVAIAMRRGIIGCLLVVTITTSLFSSVTVIRPKTGGGAKVARSMSVRSLRRRDKGGVKA
jgi:DNA-binding CsgD family transcriptional regulator